MPEVSPVIPAMRYQDAPAAIDFLVNAFGFKRNMVVEGENGMIEHAQLTHGTGMVMLGSTRGDDMFSDQGPISIYVIVDDVQAHHDRAAAAGAEIVMAPEEQDYGGSSYTARDPEGNWWSFGDYTPEI